MGKTIKINLLDSKSIGKAVSELINYKNDLDTKCQRFCDELGHLGYAIALARSQDVPGRYGTHKMGQYVFFRVDTVPMNDGCKGFLVGMQKQFLSSWVSNKVTHYAIVYPLEMLEFGSGALAVSSSEAMSKFGIYSGQGSMATAGHEKDTDWGIGNRWTAIKPTMPMYNAYITMLGDMDRLGREIFKG